MSDDRLLAAFYKAALFLKDRVENDGWRWSSNYLREHVRCASGLQFTNSVSPTMLRELRKAYPSLRPFIDVR